MRRFVVLTLLACGMVHAAAPPPGRQAPEEDVLDEVVVSGKRLFEMRRDLIRAEDRFYALYNELNPDKDFDVSCKIDVPTGTRLMQRVCRAVFVERAQEAEGVALLLQMRGEQSGTVPPATLVAMAREDDFVKNMLKVINENPSLRRLVREHEDMEKKYAAERQKRMKGKLIMVD